MSESIKKHREEAYILGALAGFGFGMIFAWILLVITGWAKELTIGGTTICIVIAKEDWNTWIGIIALIGVPLLLAGLWIEARRKRKLLQQP